MRTGNVLSLPPLRAGDKTAGQDVFLSTAGTPNPPGQAPPDT